MVFQPNLIWHFEDLTGVAFRWRYAIEKIQNGHLGKGEEKLSKDEPSKTQGEQIESPRVPLQTGESGQTQTKSTVEPTSEESPSETQEPLGFSKPPVGNQNCQIDSGRVELHAISLSEPSLYCAGVKLVQSAQVFNVMDVAEGTVVDKESFRDVKDDYKAAPVDNEKLAFNTTEVEAVLVKNKLTNEDYGLESVLDSNENAGEAKVDQLPCTQEQVWTA